eukprot:TRINITY_DN6479_c0_g1_i1.p1 TRINITY_DN6479_c0_g1~~TRINITY_DN6479_c0_g1_i1.p1  ORF type:complete len:287 (+),score=95.31 TRINITY_DN6479_c0_g1_i1:224-1084(+)
MDALRRYAIQGCAELIDIGANITRLPPVELTRQLQRASDAGVKRVIITGTSIKASSAAERMVDRNVNEVQLYFTAGVHPHDASTWDGRTKDQIVRMLRKKTCVAVGEMGLDYDRMRSTREQQLHVFRELVSIAATVDKPLFIHERDLDAHRGEPIGSHADLCSILDEYKIDPSRVCIHCFTADEASLLDYIGRGYYIGITGFVCMKSRGAALRASCKHIPLDRLMIETDAPYMKPDNVPKELGIQGRNNEPCTLPSIVRTLAECYGVKEAELANSVTANTKKFFNL